LFTRSTRVTLLIAIALGLATAAPAAAADRAIALGFATSNSGSSATYQDFTQRFGRTPAIWMLWRTWRGKHRYPDGSYLRYLQRNRTVPMISWQPIDASGRTKVSWRAIRDGNYDGYIARFARIVRSTGGRVIIRLAHEMDGDWFEWGLCGASSARKRQFRQAWRRVVTIFRSVGATNARFLWCPATPSRRCPASRWTSFYPGNGYVDYLGVTAYNWGKPSNGLERRTRPWAEWRSMAATLGPGVRALTRIAPNKSIIIAELGSSPDAPSWTSKAAWIRAGYPAAYQRYPGIKGIVYFNHDMRSPPQHHEDWRLTSPNNSPLSEYRTLLRDERFQGSID
jgi:hypothetical protein